jgi:uncharacterized membrane protein (DUF2068 family)
MSGIRQPDMAAGPHSNGPRAILPPAGTKVHQGLRMVALFEAIKGTLAWVVAIGALLLPQHDLQQFVRNLIYGLRLDPTTHYTSLFVREASLVSARDLGRVSAGLVAYGLFRFCEAFGLWWGYAWAEWLAVVSGTIFIPYEVATLFRRFTLGKLCVLSLNLLIVVFVAMMLTRSRQKEPPPPPGPGPSGSGPV